MESGQSFGSAWTARCRSFTRGPGLATLCSEVSVRSVERRLLPKSYRKNLAAFVSRVTPESFAGARTSDSCCALLQLCSSVAARQNHALCFSVPETVLIASC